MCGIKECTVVEKNVRIPERFFDNHYKIESQLRKKCVRDRRSFSEKIKV